ncbi:sensor histidine kinase [Marivita geojedonensis]|nr:ATP-binding protein [Marivita geojedonensis]PRY78565.1 two-component system C4-dicarboxylate transport sensor histidine kinase DctB [Marivita geojedonensis]
MVGLRLVSPGNSPHLPAMSDTLKTRLHRKALTWAVALIAGAAAMVLALLLLLFPALERVYLNQLGSREASTLGLAVEGLNGSLRRFEALPGLIAERPDLARALRDPSDTALIDRVNADLRRTAEEVGLSDIFLIDPDGLTIAASNHWKELSFVGQNFAYRPYFTLALAGQQGRFFALGTTSGERGYFFAEAVRDTTGIVGVLAVKFTVDAFEAAWRDGTNDIIVQDDAGVIFMASRPDWHFRSLGPLSDAARDAIEATKKYPMDQLLPLQITQQPFDERFRHLSITGDDGQTERFIVQSQMIPEAGWQVSLLTPTEQAWTRAMGTVALTALLLLLVGLIATVVIQRRMQLQERIRAALSMQEELEHRVTRRTAELKEANRLITQEVEERRAAETLLRQTQTELIQAGKLAALGQMAAALSHEFNQPLAAVKSFARNAAAYLDRGQPDKVRQNVGMIDDMADRLAAISTHLRNFARRPGEKTEPILLNRALDSALIILEPKMRASGCRVDRGTIDGEIWVLGGQVRLQQVFVNLLSNAVDAMSDQTDPLIDLSIDLENNRVHVSVRDRGTGMTDAEIAQLFDPFFTTKEPGKGMGLGLSISYNIVRDFGGTLEGRNHPDGGAVFTVSLTLAEAPSMAAAE